MAWSRPSSHSASSDKHPPCWFPSGAVRTQIASQASGAVYLFIYYLFPLSLPIYSKKKIRSNFWILVFSFLGLESLRDVFLDSIDPKTAVCLGLCRTARAADDVGRLPVFVMRQMLGGVREDKQLVVFERERVGGATTARSLFAGGRRKAARQVPPMLRGAVPSQPPPSPSHASGLRDIRHRPNSTERAARKMDFKFKFKPLYREHYRIIIPRLSGIMSHLHAMPMISIE